MASPSTAGKSTFDGRAQSLLPWQWPAWALDADHSCIEVYIEDGHNSEWVEAEPHSLVAHGNDTYLCAEYYWAAEDEVYLQDFSAHHVRRRGGTATVLDAVGTSKAPAARASLRRSSDPSGRAGEGFMPRRRLSDAGAVDRSSVLLVCSELANPSPATKGGPAAQGKTAKRGAAQRTMEIEHQLRRMQDVYQEAILQQEQDHKDRFTKQQEDFAMTKTEAQMQEAALAQLAKDAENRFALESELKPKGTAHHVMEEQIEAKQREVAAMREEANALQESARKSFLHKKSRNGKAAHFQQQAALTELETGKLKAARDECRAEEERQEAHANEQQEFVARLKVEHERQAEVVRRQAEHAEEQLMMVRATQIQVLRSQHGEFEAKLSATKEVAELRRSEQEVLAEQRRRHEAELNDYRRRFETRLEHADVAFVEQSQLHKADVADHEARLEDCEMDFAERRKEHEAQIEEHHGQHEALMEQARDRFAQQLRCRDAHLEDLEDALAEQQRRHEARSEQMEGVLAEQRRQHDARVEHLEGAFVEQQQRHETEVAKQHQHFESRLYESTASHAQHRQLQEAAFVQFESRLAGQRHRHDLESMEQRRRHEERVEKYEGAMAEHLSQHKAVVEHVENACGEQQKRADLVEQRCKDVEKQSAERHEQCQAMESRLHAMHLAHLEARLHAEIAERSGVHPQKAEELLVRQAEGAIERHLETSEGSQRKKFAQEQAAYEERLQEQTRAIEQMKSSVQDLQRQLATRQTAEPKICAAPAQPPKDPVDEESFAKRHGESRAVLPAGTIHLGWRPQEGEAVLGAAHATRPADGREMLGRFGTPRDGCSPEVEWQHAQFSWSQARGCSRGEKDRRDAQCHSPCKGSPREGHREHSRNSSRYVQHALLGPTLDSSGFHGPLEKSRLALHDFNESFGCRQSPDDGRDCSPWAQTLSVFSPHEGSDANGTGTTQYMSSASTYSPSRTPQSSRPHMDDVEMPHSGSASWAEGPYGGGSSQAPSMPSAPGSTSDLFRGAGPKQAPLMGARGCAPDACRDGGLRQFLQGHSSTTSSEFSRGAFDMGCSDFSPPGRYQAGAPELHRSSPNLQLAGVPRSGLELGHRTPDVHGAIGLGLAPYSGDACQLIGTSLVGSALSQSALAESMLLSRTPGSARSPAAGSWEATGKTAGATELDWVHRHQIGLAMAAHPVLQPLSSPGLGAWSR